MKCPNCGANLRVISSRIKASECEVMRRRECTSCKRRFTTLEMIIESKEQNRQAGLKEILEKNGYHTRKED